jgi:hypothetical protein
VIWRASVAKVPQGVNVRRALSLKVRGSKVERWSLNDAGALFGVSGGAMRARIKKSPKEWPLERDNAGKLWLLLDPERVAQLRVSKPGRAKPNRVSMTPAIEATLTGQAVALAAATARAEAAERARDQAEGERDHWRKMALALAARPRWRWWPF